MPEKNLSTMLMSAKGRAEIAAECNAMLPEEFAGRSFVRRAARIFKDQHTFMNTAERPVTLPTFELTGKFPLYLRNEPNIGEEFADLMGSMVEAICNKENEVLVDIAQASAEAALAGITDGLAPYLVTGTEDYEKLFYRMQKAGAGVTHLVYHPSDYGWVSCMPGLELERRRKMFKQGVLGYYTSRAFEHGRKTTVMQSRVVKPGCPLLLGARPEDEIDVNPSLYDLILTERSAPTLTIEETQPFPTVIISEEIGIGASGKFVQQIRLPELPKIQD